MVRSRSSSCLPKQHACRFANHCTLGYIDFITSRSVSSLERCSTVLRQQCFMQVVSVSKVDSRTVAQARHARGDPARHVLAFSSRHITGIVMYAGDGTWLGRNRARHTCGDPDCLLPVLFDQVDEFRDFLTCFSRTVVALLSDRLNSFGVPLRSLVWTCRRWVRTQHGPCVY